MGQEILEQMKSYLGDNGWQERDFSIDQDALEGKNEPFVWLVRNSGTSLLLLGKSMEIKMDGERFRMRVFKDKLFPIRNILFWAKNEDSRVYYYDYLDLREIRVEDVEKLYLSMWGDYIEELKERYRDELDALWKPIEVIPKYDCRRHLEEQLTFAKSMNDESLQRIIDRLGNRERDAVDHKICLYKNGQHEFYIAEKVNGEMTSSGEIVFHENKSDNRWEQYI